VFLLVTSALLAVAEALGRKRLHQASAMSWRQALLVGAAQAAAIAPGISRSGATIAAGLGAGLDREKAARFSFLLSIPIILAATGMSFLDVASGSVDFPSAGVALAGFVAAAVTGYLAIAGLLAYRRSRSLYVFSVYTAALGTAVILWRYLA
jgi:undecaprenyl-diphosphatase